MEIHIQELINLEAKKFIKELNGREMTVADYRKIVFGNCTNILRSNAKKCALTNFVKHPNVQLRGVGRNGIIINEHINDAEEEVQMWRNLSLKQIKGN